MAIKIKKRYLGRDTRNKDLINEKIRFPQVLLIDSDGQNKGQMSSREALRLADERELDLVCISPSAKIPVVKITDYGRYKFDKKKKEQENKKNQQVIETKEVRLTANIGKHDIDTKLKKAREFLLEGQRLKISLRFRGRELQNTKSGYQIMNNFVEALSEISEVDRAPVLNRIFLDTYLKSTVKKTVVTNKNNTKEQSNTKPEVKENGKQG